MFTKKDFIPYLLYGGSPTFSKPIKLNKAQLSKLDNELARGAKPIFIEGKPGFLDGKGYWTPATKLEMNNYNKRMNK